MKLINHHLHIHCEPRRQQQQRAVLCSVSQASLPVSLEDFSLFFITSEESSRLLLCIANEIEMKCKRNIYTDSCWVFVGILQCEFMLSSTNWSSECICTPGEYRGSGPIIPVPFLCDYQLECGYHSLERK